MLTFEVLGGLTNKLDLISFVSSSKTALANEESNGSEIQNKIYNQK